MKGIAGYLGLGVALLLALPGSALAQPPSPDSVWGHGTTVNVFGGLASGASTTRGLAGAALGWEITPALGIEGSGTWFDRGRGADAFAADLTVQAGLAGPRVAVPFLEAGIGFYRASFNAGAPDVPAFYRLRMGGHGMAPTSRDTFTDPSFIIGGGVNLYVSRHIAIRPVVNAVVVRRNSDSRVLTTFSIHLAYHFEQHPLIPTPH